MRRRVHIGTIFSFNRVIGTFRQSPKLLFDIVFRDWYFAKRPRCGGQVLLIGARRRSMSLPPRTGERQIARVE